MDIKALAAEAEAKLQLKFIEELNTVSPVLGTWAEHEFDHGHNVLQVRAMLARAMRVVDR